MNLIINNCDVTFLELIYHKLTKIVSFYPQKFLGALEWLKVEQTKYPITFCNLQKLVKT